MLTKLLWEPPEFSQAELHPAFREVLSKALAKDPADRYGTCVEFIGQLEKAFARCTIQALALQDEDTTQCENDVRTFIMPPVEPAAQGVEQSPPGSARVAGNEDETATDVTCGPPTPLPAPGRAEQEAPPAPPARRFATATVAAVLAAALMIAVLAAYVFLWRRPPSQPQPSETTVQDAAPAPAAEMQTEAVKPDPAEPSVAVQAQPTVPERPAMRTAKRVSKPVPPPPPTPVPAPAAPTLVSSPADAPVPAPVASQPPATPKPRAPATGTVTWTGRMQKNSVLVITEGKASFGAVAGTFPGVPIKVEVQPATLQVREAPRAENGWKQLMLYSGTDRHTSIVIRWTAVQ